jgi:hypothetical protein
MAYLIRQTNNDYIHSENENIIIPSESMRPLREDETSAEAGMFLILLLILVE